MLKIQWTSYHADEMYRLAGNKRHYIKPYGRRRQAANDLVKAGYMIRKKDIDNPDYVARFVYVENGEFVTFTELGKQWILSLNPQDFKPKYWFHIHPFDVERWQASLKDKTFPETPDKVFEIEGVPNG